MASADALKLDILTPLGVIRRGLTVPGVEVPGFLGELGALPHHEAMLTAVLPGVVRFRDGDEAVRVAVGSGFLRVTEDGSAVLLVDRAKLAGDVDVPATTAALKDATAKLEAERGSIDDADYRLLAAERAWLSAQLRAAGA
jgi:F-type H+-transporting ATPase subunit epsilon